MTGSNTVRRLSARLRPATIALLAATVVAGCSIKYPTTRTDVVDERPQLVIANAADGAVLLVNGVEIGPAAEFDGSPGSLRLSSGSHDVQIVQGGQVVYRQRVFLTDGVVRTVTVPSS